MIKRKLVASSLLEVIVSMTLILTILTITFTIFLNIYKSSLTLQTIKNSLFQSEILNITIKDKKYISFNKALPNGNIYQDIKDTSNGLRLIEIKCDTNAPYNEIFKLWVTK